MQKKILLVTLIILISTGLASASTGYEGFSFVGGASESSSSFRDKDSNTDDQIKNSVRTYRIGWTLTGGLYLGAVQETDSREENNQGTSSQKNGLSLGISDSGSFILYHWITEASMKLKNGSEYEGTGSGMDFGHHFQLNDYLSIGIQLSFREMKFNTQISQGSNIDSDLESSRMFPVISFGLTL
ncbi:MAG: hypothetical protein GY786_14095 [Proteobacteria bacterium]|nr:hypothetical protein [Pseudomonadota bacterium]